MMGLKKQRWSPYVCGVLLGLLQVPVFLLLNMTIDRVWRYPTAEEHAWFVAVKDVMNSHVPVSSDKRFYWHKLWVLALIAGVFFSAWLGGVKLRIPEVVKSLRGILRLMLAMVIAFAGGFLLFSGVCFVVLERFDFWQIIGSLGQLSVSSYVIVPSMFAGAAIVGLLLPRTRGE